MKRAGTLGWRLGYALGGAALLALLGLGGWFASVHFRAAHHLGEARKALAKDRIEEARAHLARSLELRPDSAEVQFLAARTARRAGDAGAAEAHLKRSEELGWAAAAVELEGVLQEAQRDPRPHESYLGDRLRRGHPESDAILEALSRGYVNLFDLPKALHCLDAWLERNPDAVRALEWRGDVKDRLGRYEPAAADFQRAVDLDPENDEARTRLAKLLMRQRRPAEAVPHLELLHQRKPDDVEVLRTLARSRQDQNRREEAERLLDRALALNPDDVLTLTQRGLLDLEAGRLEEAEGALRRAASLAPFEREPLYNLGRCLHARGKNEEAREWEERLTRVEADLALVKKFMGAVMAAPQDPGPRREMGVIFLRNSQDKEGLRWLQSALQCDPGHRPTHRALADYYQKQGREDLAARHRQLAE
jgi:tetratricopeptide (TPR) repeat protein